MKLTVSADTSKMEAQLRDLVSAAGDPRAALREVADDFCAMMDTQFRTGGALTGGWAPRTGRRNATQTSQVGVAEGVLRRSLTGRGRYSHERITRDGLTIGTTAPHARLFDRGRGRNQPARKLVPPRAVLSRRWAPILERAVARAVRGGR